VTEAENDIEKTPVELNDNMMRLIGIPFFGAVIPNVTGLLDGLSFKDPTYWLGYIYFITLAACIWQGNRYLLFRTRQRFTWFEKPIEKLILLLINNIFFTAPITIAWLCIWYGIIEVTLTKWNVVEIVTLINVICVLFVTHVYETVFMVKEQQSELLRSADLSRAKAEAELAALKNQIDPHFMFNSLNSLSYLISTDTIRAQLFTENLAEVFRYILAQKEQSLVLLEDEFNFMNKYVALLTLRFGRAIIIEKNFVGDDEKTFFIPPISAFVALENAVKHNEISEELPLTLDFKIENNCLIVCNLIKPKRSIQHSSKIGLRNLAERFKLTTGANVHAEIKDNIFKLSMPLIPTL
jgi:sensor histidine kinase YesM